MKIAIVGTGTASVITALVCVLEGFDIEFFYDLDKPFLRVGESTTPHLSDLLRRVFNINIGDLYNQDLISYKAGVKFIKWGKSEEFKMHFDFNKIAFHMENEYLNEYVHSLFKSKGVKYNEYKILDYKISDNKIIINEESYDFAFFCTGWNSDSEDYLDPPFETVNSAVLFKKTELDKDLIYTIHRATPDGWQFELPFPQRNLSKCGYLYNNKITKNINLNFDISNKLSWKPKYAKKLLENPFVAKNGNNLFFIEPIHALSILYQEYFARLVCSFLKNKLTVELINDVYHEKMKEYFMSLALHYKFGSFYNSEFWNFAQKESEKYFNENKNMDIDKYSTLWYEDLIHGSKKSSIGVFTCNDMYMIYKNLDNFDLKQCAKQKVELL